jgi:hypothetical protein
MLRVFLVVNKITCFTGLLCLFSLLQHDKCHCAQPVNTVRIFIPIQLINMVMEQVRIQNTNYIWKVKLILKKGDISLVFFTDISTSVSLHDPLRGCNN